MSLIRVNRTNSDWLEDLRSPHNEEALADLRQLVSRGLHFGLVNRVDENRLDDLVEDFSQDALLRIMENLDSFRGESKFITWATKVAVRVAYSELRRKRWKDVSIEALQQDADGEETKSEPGFLADPKESPEEKTAVSLLMQKLEQLIESELTERQRSVLLATINQEIPVEELAIQMGTNRNALYKMLHDARKKLLGLLYAEGFTAEDLMLGEGNS